MTDDVDTREGPAFARGPMVGAAFGLALLAAATATGSTASIRCSALAAWSSSSAA